MTKRVQLIGLLRVECSLQRHHVGALYACADRVPFNDQSVDYEYLDEFPGHRGAGDDCVWGASAGVVVAWCGDDGCGVYSGWDEGARRREDEEEAWC